MIVCVDVNTFAFRPLPLSVVNLLLSGDLLWPSIGSKLIFGASNIFQWRHHFGHVDNFLKREQVSLSRAASVRSGLQARVKAPCFSIRAGTCRSSLTNGSSRCEVQASPRKSRTSSHRVYVTGVPLTVVHIPWWRSQGFTAERTAGSAKFQVGSESVWLEAE